MPLDAVADHVLAIAAVHGLDADVVAGACPRLFHAVGSVPLPSDAARVAVQSLEHEDLPHALGAVYSGRLAGDARRRGGVVYTPRPLARGLVEAALDGLPAVGLSGWRALDPACGGGAFLLAMADALEARGVDVDEIVGDRLWGVDVDPGAIAVAEAATAVWAALRGGAGSAGTHLTVGDALLDDPATWWPDSQPFELVVGNPPFLGQLAEATRHDDGRRIALRQRWGADVQPYVDAAALFLVAARSMLAMPGRIALVQPLSMLGARDAEPARAAAIDGARLHGLWLATEAVFDADVRTCAPIIAVDMDAAGCTAVRRWSGLDFEPLPDAPPPDGDAAATWAPLAATALGVPTVIVREDAGCVADLSRVTAGFRDQFYGLVPHVREATDAETVLPLPSGIAGLVTSRLIDVGHLAWGERPTRFAGRRWSRPVVDLASLRIADPTLGRWVDERLRPKLLVANQTKVVEVAADELGWCVPSVPVISVELNDPSDLMRLAAALSSPPVTAWAFHRHAGSAMSADAIRLSAKLLAAAPLPSDRAAWDEAAEQFAAGALNAFAVAATVAYGLPADDELVGWWLGRLPAASRSD